MRVLLVSTYEMGHQPLHVAAPAARLASAGHDVRAIDLSIDRWDPDLATWAEAMAVSVPLHTATRLAVQLVAEVRRHRPDLPTAFYGLYAGMETEPADIVDARFSGEYLDALSAWVIAGAPRQPPTAVVSLRHERAPAPARHLLPSLDRYAHLAASGEERQVGYVEASHGCAHRCRHCPVPVVYDGRIRVVDVDAVLHDIAQLAESGATHITFGDPDFLNGAAHARRVVDAMHARFPTLTFDCTTKVEHVLRHEDLWPEFAAAGCLFVVSAIECMNDDILRRLDKGHTAAEAADAVHVLRRHGIETRPSFLPFTPWSTVEDVLDIADFVVAHDLIGNVDPVQFTIRLLVPTGSLLLDDADLVARLGHYDAEHLTWTWHADDARTDALHAELSALAGAGAAAAAAVGATFLQIYGAILAAAGEVRDPLVLAGSVEGRPRLTEPWFC